MYLASSLSLSLSSPPLAGVMRSVLDKGVLSSKLYYLGPMFRRESPQRGRYRQFTQFGVELIGDKSPYSDAEVIALAADVLNKLQVSKHTQVSICLPVFPH
jgi:histidyl-tRNA synthetase